MKTAVIFDLDGTLLDTLEDLLDASNHALTECGFPKRTLPELRAVVGNGAANQIRKLLPEGTGEDTVQQVLKTYLPYYAAHCRGKTAPYRGIPEALRRLRQEYALAIVSNKPDRAVKELCADFFPGLYALGETPDCPRKPAPDMLHKAMKHLGAERAVYVGDSEVDIATAANGGVPCVSVTWGFREEEQLLSAGAGILCREPEALFLCIQQAERSRYGK